MKNDPQFRVLELEAPARFSLGVGTQIASVNIKLADIRLRDMPPGLTYDDKRDWAVEVATEMASEKFTERFGFAPDTKISDDRPISFLVVHQSDSVTVEIWRQGPSRLRVNMIPEPLKARPSEPENS